MNYISLILELEITTRLKSLLLSLSLFLLLGQSYQELCQFLLNVVHFYLMLHDLLTAVLNLLKSQFSVLLSINECVFCRYIM